MRVAPHLAPIRRNVPNNPALHEQPRLKPYQVNSQNLDEIQPVESDRELFTSATDVFMSIDSEKLRQVHQAEFGPYFEYLSDPKKQPPSSESKTSMSYYSENGGLLYRSYLPGHLRKRSTFRDQLVIPSACIYPWCCTHAMITPCLVDISLTNIPLTKSAIDFGGRRYITTSKLGVRIASLANDVKHRIAGPSYPQVTYLLIAPINVFQIGIVEYKTEPVSPTGLNCSYALTIIDHLTRSAVLVVLPDKKE